jgi:hypothetical protein
MYGRVKRANSGIMKRTTVHNNSLHPKRLSARLVMLVKPATWLVGECSVPGPPRG